MTENINIRDNSLARRRLIGASALLLVAIGFFPIVMDQNPSSPLQDIEVKFAKNESKLIVLKNKDSDNKETNKNVSSWLWPWQSEEKKINKDSEKNNEIKVPGVIPKNNNKNSKENLLTPTLQEISPPAFTPSNDENSESLSNKNKDENQTINKSNRKSIAINEEKNIVENQQVKLIKPADERDKKLNNNLQETKKSEQKIQKSSNSNTANYEPVTSFEKDQAKKNKMINSAKQEQNKTEQTNNGVMKKGNAYFVYTKTTNKAATAIEWKNKLAAKGITANSEPIATQEGVKSRLKLGPYNSLEAANSAASKIRSLGL